MATRDPITIGHDEDMILLFTNAVLAMHSVCVTR
jgi:hypothetical protein